MNPKISVYSYGVCACVHAGHFPWLFSSPLMKYLFSFSEPGKAAAYIKRVTLDLVRARRETQNAEKVCDINRKNNASTHML